MELSVLSWNIANCKPSNASINWSTQKNADEIRKQILKLSPDVVFLQEAPQYFCQNFSDYLHRNPVGELLCAKSHCPFVFVLLHKRLKPKISSSISEEGFLLVNVTLTIADQETEFCLSSFHLAPYKENAKTRIAQLETLRHHASESEAIHLFGGDSNMRKDEWAKTTLSGCYRDSWEECGSNHKTRWTWNSKINHYHKDGFKFMSRYDRMFTLGSQKQKLVATEFRVLGRHQTWYLSDHFGTFCKYELKNDGELLDFVPYELNGETVLVEASSLSTKSNLVVYKNINDEDDEKLYHIDRSKLKSYEEEKSAPKKRKIEEPSESDAKRAKPNPSSDQPSKSEQVFNLVSQFVAQQGGYENIDGNAFNVNSNYNADYDEDLQRALALSLQEH